MATNAAHTAFNVLTTGIAVVLVVGFWFLVFRFLWRGGRKRQCPRCGRSVKAGKMTCKGCGFDFNTVGRS